MTLIIAAPAFAEPPSLLKMFARNPIRNVDSEPRELSEEDGPWLILASTFVGEGAKERAERLAEEIRTDMKLPAFTYNEQFDFTGDYAKLGSSTRLRYANQYEYEAWAVLVGEYDTVEHPAIERDLQRLKTAEPQVLRDPDEVAAETSLSTPATIVKAMHRKWIKSQDTKRGPMANAFVTRNPKLPPQYFEQPQVDSFVRKLNEDKEFSLLECEGKYTVVVRTFEGFGTIMDGKRENEFEPDMRRLDRFARDAARMTKALRKKGEQAFQYHDRQRSIVTVGSFDSLGRELPNGGFEYAAEIRKLMQRFKAFNVDPSLARQVPARVRGAAANNIAMIPFDVEPRPIAVPKVSKRSLYTAASRLR